MKSDDNDRKPKVWDKGSAPRSSFDQSIERAVQASLLRDSDDSLSCPKPVRELVDALTEENKALLRSKYTEAKALGEAVNACRARIQGMKTYMEQKRMLQAVDGGGTGAAGAEAPALDAELAQVMDGIGREKSAYRSSFERLKELKREIEHIQRLLEQSRRRVQADFEQWYAMQQQQQQQQQQRGGGGGAGGGASSDGPGARPASRGHALRTPPRAGAAVPAASSPVMSTGNRQADEDIAAFYRARDEVLRANRLQQAG